MITVHVTDKVEEILLETAPGMGGIIGSDADPGALVITDAKVSAINGVYPFEQPPWIRFEIVPLPPVGGRVRVLLKPFVRPLEAALLGVDSFEILGRLSDGINPPVEGRWPVTIDRTALQPKDVPVLIATYLGGGIVEWTLTAPDPADEAERFVHVWGTAPGVYSSYTLRAIVGTGAQTFQTSGHAPGVPVYGRVRWQNDFGDGPQSNEASVVWLDAPEFVSAEATTDTITAAVTPVSGATGYRGYIAASAGGSYALAATSGTPTLEFTGLTAGTTYFVRFTAIAPGIESAQSSAEEVATLVALTAPTLSVGEVGADTVEAEWTAVPTADAYELQHDDESTFTAPEIVQLAAVTSHIITDLTPGVERFIRVRGKRGIESGPLSNVVSATPEAGTAYVPIVEGTVFHFMAEDVEPGGGGHLTSGWRDRVSGRYAMPFAGTNGGLLTTDDGWPVVSYGSAAKGALVFDTLDVVARPYAFVLIMRDLGLGAGRWFFDGIDTNHRHSVRTTSFPNHLFNAGADGTIFGGHSNFFPALKLGLVQCRRLASGQISIWRDTSSGTNVTVGTHPFRGFTMGANFLGTLYGGNFVVAEILCYEDNSDRHAVVREHFRVKYNIW